MRGCGAWLARWWKKVLGVAIAAFATVTLVLSFVPGSVVQRLFSAMLAAVNNGGNVTFAGGLVFFGIDALVITLALPATPFNLAAGFIFGFWAGSLISVTGITLGAMVAFMLGRTLMRSWAQAKAQSVPKIRAIERAVGDNGVTLVFLLRLSPLMPLAIISYALGATKVPFLTYTVASSVGLAPATVAYCFLGTMLKDLRAIWSEGKGNNIGQTIWLCLVVVSTLALIIFVTYITKRALDNALNAELEERSPTIVLDSMERGEAGIPNDRNSTNTAAITVPSRKDPTSPSITTHTEPIAVVTAS